MLTESEIKAYTVDIPNDIQSAQRASGSLERLVGPCADVEQRIKDLYIVNTVAGWAQNNLRVLAEMASDHNLPEWYVKEVKRIGSEIETVASREAARRPNAPLQASGADDARKIK